MSVVQRSINDELRAGHLDKTAALRNRQFDQISDASHRGFYRVDFCEQRLFELCHALIPSQTSARRHQLAGAGAQHGR